VGNDVVLKKQPSGPSSGIGAANSTVKGLVINRWGEGIHVSESGTTGNKVIGNYLDADASDAQGLSSSLTA
jgi:hypothetical protein